MAKQPQVYKGTKKPPRSSKSVIVIYEGKAETYRSISEAARATGLTRQRIIRALKRSDGFIPFCPFSVDFPLLPSFPDGAENAPHGLTDEKIDKLDSKPAHHP